jgi:hypothetical protein
MGRPSKSDRYTNKISASAFIFRIIDSFHKLPFPERGFRGDLPYLIAFLDFGTIVFLKPSERCGC